MKRDFFSVWHYLEQGFHIMVVIFKATFSDSRNNTSTYSTWTWLRVGVTLP